VNTGKNTKARGCLEPRAFARAAYGEPTPYWTLNFQLLGWLFAMLGFWSSGLPTKSCAPVVTVAL
jgi:hypothetical protein